MNQISKTLRLVAAAAIFLGGSLSTSAQLNENCVVSILNRTARVQPDGGWVITNVPAGAAMVRARATCSEGGVTRTGQSDHFSVPASGLVEGIEIRFDAPKPDPAKLQLAASSTVIANVGETLQLTATATFPDGSSREVNGATAGTSYTTSNPAIATVSGSGLVTAAGSGTAIIGAMNEGALALLRITIAGAADSDNDGMPNDFEAANGLDPRDAADALLDADGDGLSNLDEYRNGTGVRVPDSDGDGVRDGLEMQTGSDPLDAASFNFGRALRRIEVTPSPLALRVNPLFGEAAQQLTVMGTLLDGVTLDLTAAARGTTYASSDLTVCSFTDRSGEVIAGNTGQCSVTIANSGFSSVIPGSVEAYQPHGIASIALPGYANNVKVRAGYAFVASGDEGLQVVDVRNPETPAIVASLALTGVAIDLRIRGDLAYVAAGPAGLHIVDISNPAAPRLVGGVAAGEDAQDVWIDGDHAYVATGGSGLVVVSIANPAAPVVVGTLTLNGTARGVAVEQGTAAVVTDLELAVVDVRDPATPQRLATLAVAGEPKDVVLRGGYAYIAAYTGGLQIIDLRSPAAPVVAGAIPDQFAPRDVILADQFAVLAEQMFPNAIPFVDVRIAAEPVFRGIIDLSPLGDYAATGIDITERYVFLTEESYAVWQDYGTSGDTRLFIGEYQSFTDTAGVKPTVRIVSPVATDSLVRESQAIAMIEASDDVAVAQIVLSVDGQSVATAAGRSAALPFTVPVNASVTLTAQAVDYGGNSASASVTVTTISDPLTIVTGVVKNADGQPVAGASVTVTSGGPQPLLLVATTDASGRYRFDSISTINGDYKVQAAAQVAGQPATGTSPSVAPARGGTTTIPDVVIRSTVWIARPVPGTSAVDGDEMQVEIGANPALGVQYVIVIVDGTSYYGINSAPWVTTVRVGASGLTKSTISAIVYDSEWKEHYPVEAVVQLVPDPLTTASGRVLNEEGVPVANAEVTIGVWTKFTDASGRYEIAALSTVGGAIVVSATATVNDTILRGTSMPTLPVRGGITAIPDLVIRETACGEAYCVPSEGMYISHFSGIDCGGTESYYTPYDGGRYQCRTWDGEGVCGSVRRIVTNRSVRVNNGPCQNAWPNGNTLGGFVTIYRGAPAKTTVSGLVKDTDGQPVADATVTFGEITASTSALGAYELPGVPATEPITVYAKKTVGNEQLNGSAGPVAPVIDGVTSMPDIVVRATPCGEPECVPAQGVYVSHFTELNCTGTESYFTPYDGYGFACRSWDGEGICGTIRRTVTNKSAKVAGGQCLNEWPGGNTISDFVTIYRGVGDQ
jgi:hypothetical protein